MIRWLLAVSCATHAVVDMIERVLSVTARLTIPYPIWQSIDGRQTDWVDLAFNEPWFLIEELLWASIA